MLEGAKEDRRIQRTRNMLYEALLDLMIEKGYDAITVQDIIDRANIGRSTFYSHFTDKEQLLLSSIGQLREFLKQQSNHRTVSTIVLTNIPGEYRFGFSLPMFQHAQSHKRIYRATVGKESGAVVLLHMQRMFTDLISNEIAVLFPNSVSLPVPGEVAVKFVVSTYLMLLIWWMDGDMPCSAADMDRMFHQLILSGLNPH